MDNNSTTKKRKTFTSTEVKQRYNKKTYKNYNVNFRYTEDAELIRLVEAEKSKGCSTSEAFRNLILKNNSEIR